MKIESNLKDKVLIDYFFIEGSIDIDCDYFIKEIKKGFEKNHNHYLTNIEGKMTSWSYFNNNINFLKILKQFISYVDKEIPLPKYKLYDSWGLCVEHKGKTKKHDHKLDIWSGVIYLNDHPQTLDFYGINKKIKPSKGKFALFSSFLEHGCEVNEVKDNKWGISFNMGQNR